MREHVFAYVKLHVSNGVFFWGGGQSESWRFLLNAASQYESMRVGSTVNMEKEETTKPSDPYLIAQLLLISGHSFLPVSHSSCTLSSCTCTGCMGLTRSFSSQSSSAKGMLIICLKITDPFTKLWFISRKLTLLIVFIFSHNVQDTTI